MKSTWKRYALWIALTEAVGGISALLSRVTTADRRLEDRPDRPFSREELAVLMAALLIDL